MPNKSRTFEKGGRPDWPSFRVRNIAPQLWEHVKARAIRESRDGNPRLNGIVLTLLQRYADQGLPASAPPEKAAAAPPAPTAEPEPINWKASYHQACDDADAYKADAEKRLVKMEQNWRSCQHEIAYLRERLKDTRVAPPERVSERKD